MREITKFKVIVIVFITMSMIAFYGVTKLMIESEPPTGTIYDIEVSLHKEAKIYFGNYTGIARNVKTLSFFLTSETDNIYVGRIYWDIEKSHPVWWNSGHSDYAAINVSFSSNGNEKIDFGDVLIINNLKSGIYYSLEAGVANTDYSDPITLNGPTHFSTGADI